MENSRLKIINEPYLNRKQIQILFKVGRESADKIYNQADMIDSQMRFRAVTNKVRTQTALAVQELDYELLLKQIKNAESALPKQSAQI